jgi:hypothetical protein
MLLDGEGIGGEIRGIRGGWGGFGGMGRARVMRDYVCGSVHAKMARPFLRFG